MSSLSTVRGAVPQAISVPWHKIVLWTVLFQLAWFWRKLPPLLNEGAMPDTDDFQRLAQVRSWMAGQGWYDIVNHRMDPPLGADMHWSRLVDLPIAAITWGFGLFFSPVMAERLAAFVWPTALLVMTVFVILAICRKLDRNANPLLALLFTVTCITALTEFMPGRIDHHGVQILFFCLMLLGLVSTQSRWGHFLVGIALAASVSVGLDAIFIIAFLLGWVVLDWVRGSDLDGRRLNAMAAGLAVTAVPLYVLNFPPSQWLSGRCDANSAFYFAALMLAAAAYGLLARMSMARGEARSWPARLGLAAATGAASIAILFTLFPACAAGPFAGLSPDLKSRWLVNVGEAKGLFEQLKTVPQLWLWGIGYGSVLLVVAAYVTWKRRDETPQIVALFATLAISIAASTLQYRTMRIGIFASIPFCVIAAEMGFAAVRERYNGKVLRGALQFAVVALLSSPAWLGAAIILFPQKDPVGMVTAAVAENATGATKNWRSEEPYLLCDKQSDYAALASLPRGLVMSDINSGPEVVIFTAHDTIGGPYHRNGKAILDMLDFFETDMENPLRIARERGISYVAFCENIEPNGAELAGSPALAVKIVDGQEPAWLERVSPAGERLHVFRVRLP